MEALQHGLWVVSTNYSGPADYLNDSNSKIIEWLPQTVLKGDYPFNHFSMWADPIIDQAASALEALYQRKEEKSAGAIASGAQYSIGHLAQKYQGVIRSYLK